MTDGALHIIGTNDEQTTCDKCGKVELRGTVILADAEGNEVGRYGTTCAGRLLGRKITRSGADTVEMVRRDRIFWALRAGRAALASGDHLAATREMIVLERSTVLHRDSEREAVAEIKAAAKAIRAERRAAGTLY